MKILFVSPDYPPKSTGGGGRVAKVLAEGLQNRGHEVIILAGYYNEDERTQYEENINGVKVIWIPLMNLFLKDLPQLIYSLPPKLSSLKYLLSFDYTEYDVIHLFAYPTHLLVDIVPFISKNKNFVLTIHAYPHYVSKDGSANSILKKFYQLYLSTIAKYVANKIGIVTVISKKTRADAIENHINQNKIKLIPNGIYLGEYNSPEVSSLDHFGISRDDFVVTSIGRISPHKGFDYALEGINEVRNDIPKLKYVLIGEIIDSNYSMKLNNIVDKNNLGDNVILTGRVTDDEKSQILSRSNVYLAPSLHEGFGLTLLEAMACNVPIIATKTAGHNDILDNMETAVMVEIKDPGNIATSLRLLHADEQLCEKLVNNSNEHVKMYSWDNIISQYESVYKTI